LAPLNLSFLLALKVNKKSNIFPNFILVFNPKLRDFLLFSGKISIAHFEGYTLSEKLQPLEYGLSIKNFIGMNSFIAYSLRYALSSK
jgi:hypothetical protein